MVAALILLCLLGLSMLVNFSQFFSNFMVTPGVGYTHVAGPRIEEVLMEEGYGSDKIAVIEALLGKCNALCIGGAMANTLLAAQGFDMKKSLYEADWLAKGRTLLETAKSKGVDLVLPTDVVTGTGIDATSGTTVKANAVPDGEMALDIGPETVQAFAQRVATAKTVFWNGPMGLFENKAFAAGTNGIAQAVADSSGFTVVGGGDSVAAVKAAGDAVLKKIGFISTGGGASLELVEGKKLPGVEALRP